MESASDGPDDRRYWLCFSLQHPLRELDRFLDLSVLQFDSSKVSIMSVLAHAAQPYHYRTFTNRASQSPLNLYPSFSFTLCIAGFAVADSKYCLPRSIDLSRSNALIQVARPIPLCAGCTAVAVPRLIALVYPTY